MYYGLIMLSVVMFGGCFALNDVYRKMRGSGLKISLQFSLASSFAGLVVMVAILFISGVKFECTWFTLLMALLSALNGFAFTFCGFKALGIINLSLYSLFSMLGGMVLPFVQGILFYSEGLSPAKVVCFVFICLALLLTVKKGEKSKGTIYYIGIFVLNGLAGVVSKIFSSAPPQYCYSTEGIKSIKDIEALGESAKLSPSISFSLVSAACSVIIAVVLLVLFFRKRGDTPKQSLASLGVSALGGIANRIANYVLLIALLQVEASVQYPMVTGGVMIVSTLICFLGKNKPSKKEVWSVVLAFIGMLALLFN